MNLFRRRQIKRRTPVADCPATLHEGMADHPVVRAVLSHRGISERKALDLPLQQLAAPEMKGINEAAGLLAEAVTNQQRILIVGDYDADGATSTALAVSVLRAMGASNVDYIVPNRFDFGYGLSPELVEVAAQRAPDLLVTVDSGIACLAGVERARALGIRVLVTDHHLPGKHLPDADAIVNPNQPGCPFPAKDTAGVGVIFYTLSALRRVLRDQGWFRKAGIAEPNMADWLDLVALGTVADVVNLGLNNRILVKAGLERIRQGRTRPGILALLKNANRDYRKVVSQDMGFAIGPRINAAGRLDDMTIGIECLLTNDWNRADEYAQLLGDLNADRKKLEQSMLDQANHVFEQMGAMDNSPVGITLYDDSFHEGVIGLLASRVKEAWHRPVVVFAAGEREGQLKGSCRSIPGLHIRDVLERIASRWPGVIIKFGGHAAAAGLTIHSEKLPVFKSAFIQTVEEVVPAEALEPSVYSDGELREDDFTLELARVLRDLLPWGQGVPEPVFDGCFDVVDRRVVGTKHMKMTLQPRYGVRNSKQTIDAIQFNSPWAGRDVPGRIRAVYRLDVNEFRGRTNLQLMVDYLEPA